MTDTQIIDKIIMGDGKCIKNRFRITNEELKKILKDSDKSFIDFLIEIEECFENFTPLTNEELKELLTRLDEPISLLEK